MNGDSTPPLPQDEPSIAESIDDPMNADGRGSGQRDLTTSPMRGSTGRCLAVRLWNRWVSEPRMLGVGSVPNTAAYAQRFLTGSEPNS